MDVAKQESGFASPTAPASNALKKPAHPSQKPATTLMTTVMEASTKTSHKLVKPSVRAEPRPVAQVDGSTVRPASPRRKPVTVAMTTAMAKSMRTGPTKVLLVP